MVATLHVGFIGAAAGSSISSGSTSNFSVGSGESTASGTENQRQITWQEAGSFSNMYIRVSSNATTAGSSTLTFRKNTANGNQTLSITHGVTGEFSDTTNSDSVVATDLVGLQFINTTGGALVRQGTAIQFAPSSAGNTLQKLQALTSSVSLTSSSINLYIPYAGILSTTGAAPLTEANSQTKMKFSATMQNLYAFFTANTSTGVATINNRKNAVSGNLTISVSAGTTGVVQDTTHTDSVVATDKVNYNINTDASAQNSTLVTIAVSMLTSSGGKTQFINAANAASAILKSVTSFGALSSSQITDTTESDKQTQSNAFTADSLQIFLRTNTVSATSNLIFRNATADGNLNVSITASTTGYFEDVAHTDSVANNAEINYKLVTGGTGTSLTPAVISLSATYTVSYAATFSGAGSLAAVGKAIHNKVATFSPAAALAAVGASTAKSVATWSPHGSLTAVGVAARRGVATLTGSASLAAVGKTLTKGIATFSPGGALAAVGKAIDNGKATFSPAGALAVVGKSLNKQRATFTASASLSAVGKSLFKGVATFSPSASLAAVGKSLNKQRATFSAAGSLSATGKSTARSVATISSSASLAAVGKSLNKQAATFSSSGSFAAVGKSTAKGVAVWSPNAAMAAAGVSARRSSFASSASASLNVSSGAGNICSIVAHAVFAASGAAIKKSVATVAPAASFAAVGVALKKAAFSSVASASLAAVGNDVVKSVCTISAAASLAARGASLAAARYTISPSAVLAASGITARRGVAAMSAHGALSAVGIAAHRSTLTISAQASLAARGKSLSSSRFIMTPSASFAAVGTRYVTPPPSRKLRANVKRPILEGRVNSGLTAQVRSRVL